MALGTYSELVASLTSWFHDRTDVAALAPDFIRLAEARFNREIDTRAMDTTTTITIAAGVSPLPLDYLAVRSLRLLAHPYTILEYTPIDMLEAQDPAVTTTPEIYSIVGSNFVFWPATDGTARLRYRGTIPALTSTNTTNWLLTAHPDLYLKASLIQAEEYFVNDERVGLWAQEVAATIQQINALDRFQNRGILRPYNTGAVI
jgi:hypothetical protein